MNSDLLYQLSLSNVDGIGPRNGKALCDKFETARDIFNASRKSLDRIENIGPVIAGNIKSFNNFRKAEKEITFIERYGIQPLFIKDKNYPQRLLNCEDPPTLLFYKGNADLNSERIISIVGTRRNTEYGKEATEKIIKELANHDVIIISGLAFGIDAIAHKAALHNNLKTVGVIAHGMDIIYPPENKGLAKEMLVSGGILTEFTSFTKPDKFNFPSRNRIVAGLSDATLIIESSIKGGSMITAEIAEGYHKDVFAVPGRITESRSEGCNRLIRDNKAAIISDPK
ncbi:MAG: DNA-processing protein DprA, partial [Chitinophagaceae bacterium]|nr:DNA-processing protein DprA [Chitinophagaceae bacterium]